MNGDDICEEFLRPLLISIIFPHKVPKHEQSLYKGDGWIFLSILLSNTQMQLKDKFPSPS